MLCVDDPDEDLIAETSSSAGPADPEAVCLPGIHPMVIPLPPE